MSFGVSIHEDEIVGSIVDADHVIVPVRGPGVRSSFRAMHPHRFGWHVNTILMVVTDRAWVRKKTIDTHYPVLPGAK